jgi:mono/diheme cytochrome c family protein
MKHRAPVLMLVGSISIGACVTGDFASPPAVSPSLIASARFDRLSAQELSMGREVFVSRCLECHTLPSVAKYSRNEWPHLVARMAGRANLTTSDQRAVIGYLRAASATVKPF